MSEALTTTDEAQELYPTLPPNKARALHVLSAGGRYKDAAAAAGVDVALVWRWARTPAFKTIMNAALLPLADDATETIGRILKDTDPDHKTKDRQLRAAIHVHRGLGIGEVNVARAGDVQVNVQVNGALSARPALVASAPAPMLEAELVPIEDTQPRRAARSSQRPSSAKQP